MRFNDKALIDLSSNIPVIEGRLFHKKLNPNNFSQTGFKERWYKLISNVLFSFNLSEKGDVDDKKPVSALILENSFVKYDTSETFSFSITFKDELDRKHIFSGRSEEYIGRWIAAIKEGSYEHWRNKLTQLQIKICTLTGKDPLLMIPCAQLYQLPLKLTTKSTKPTFQTYVLQESETSQDNSSALLSQDIQTSKKFPLAFNHVLPTPKSNHLLFDENHFSKNSSSKWPTTNNTSGSSFMTTPSTDNSSKIMSRPITKKININERQSQQQITEQMPVKLLPPPPAPIRPPRSVRNKVNNVPSGNLIDL